jgi:hypothetical protein
MLRRRLARSERHDRGPDGAAVRALVVVQRHVGAGRVTLDDSDAYWFAASRTGLTDMKLHGNTFRFEATQQDCSKGSLGQVFL